MKRQIRYGVFETNSSSSHSLSVGSMEEFEKWKRGELVLNMYDGKFEPSNGRDSSDAWNSDCVPYNRYKWDIENGNAMTVRKLDNGEEVVALLLTREW